MFKRHLEEIRSQGYAIDHGEHIPGSYCLSAIIRNVTGRGIASISISSGNFDKVKKHLDSLLQTAEVISHLVGFMGR
jgi:DNA-binding IclR family transcriptional regulator